MYITLQTRRPSRPQKHCCTIERRRRNRDQKAGYVQLCAHRTPPLHCDGVPEAHQLSAVKHTRSGPYLSSNWGWSIVATSLRQEASVPRLFGHGLLSLVDTSLSLERTLVWMVCRQTKTRIFGIRLGQGWACGGVLNGFCTGVCGYTQGGHSVHGSN